MSKSPQNIRIAALTDYYNK